MAFYYGSSVVLPDGRRENLRSLKPGSLVMGVDTDGMLTSAEVASVATSGMTDSWLNLRTTRHESALGSSHYSLIATPDHQIALHDDQYISLAEVNSESLVRGVTSSLNLDHIQKSALVGILLGDGSIHKGKHKTSNWALRWSHSDKQEDYMKWTVKVLGSLAKMGHEDASGYGSRMLTARTSHHPDIRTLFAGYDKPEGTLPETVESMINPISLLFWYLDDGSLAHSEGQQDRANFATYSFSDGAIQLLKNGLARLGIGSSVQHTTKGKTIRLNYQDARMMFTMIAPMVPPSMQYKLPVDLRGGPGWFPQPHMIPGYRKSPLRVISNTPMARLGNGSVDESSRKFRSRTLEVKTSTGNMYVNGMLLQA